MDLKPPVNDVTFTPFQASPQSPPRRIKSINFLLKKARLARDHSDLQAKALFELRRMVDDVRAEVQRCVRG